MGNLQNGITAFKSSKREDARKYLIAAVKENPKDENAWGWLYQVANNDNERIECLKKVTTINPNNEKARQLLNQLLAPPLAPTPTMTNPSLLAPSPAVTNPPQQKQIKSLEPASEKKQNPNAVKLAIVVIFVVSVLCFVILLTSNQDNFTQVGFFKDNANNRIFTISYKVGSSEGKIKTYAEGLMNTSGQMTAAYFFPEGSIIPADGLTLASSVFEANDVLYEAPNVGKWRYAYMKYLDGTSEFVDCEQVPDSVLCRNK
jgi:hypothetical protein